MANYYVDSFAYDYDMFMPAKKADNVIEIDSKRKTNKARSKTSSRPKAATRRFSATTLLLVMIFGLIAGKIYLRVQVNEVANQIDKYDTKLERALSENTALEMEIENYVSLKNLEASATELGMKKAENYQINYIDILDGDKTEIAKNGILVTADAE